MRYFQFKLNIYEFNNRIHQAHKKCRADRNGASVPVDWGFFFGKQLQQGNNIHPYGWGRALKPN